MSHLDRTDIAIARLEEEWAHIVVLCMNEEGTEMLRVNQGDAVLIDSMLADELAEGLKRGR